MLRERKSCVSPVNFALRFYKGSYFLRVIFSASKEAAILMLLKLFQTVFHAVRVLKLQQPFVKNWVKMSVSIVTF